MVGLSAFGFGFTLTPEELASLADRFRRDPLLGGPCLILNRHSGLALDAKPDAEVGGHATLWPAHAAPWQQWRIRKAGRGPRPRRCCELSVLMVSAGQMP